MKNFFLITMLMLFALAHAQRQNENWYFGRRAGLNFSDGAVQPLTNSGMDAIEGCATVSDAGGNLLFYSNGTTVWNRNHEIMLNGDQLLGYFSSTQSPVIVPVPGSENLYYIFTTGATEAPGGLHYSEVDMGMDGGLGAVTLVKNIELLPQVSEQIMATFHSNGRDIWLVCNDVDAIFNVFLITAQGISPDIVQSQDAPLIAGDPMRFPGYAKFSPDGSRLAIAQLTSGAYLYDFDNSTGEVTNRLVLSDDDNAWYGIEFSASGRFLYTSRINDTAIAQFDLQAQDIPSSFLLLFEDPFVMGGALQRAINGKIYATHANFNQLTVINDPDSPGAASNVDDYGVSVAFRRLAAGLPSPVLWPIDFEITAEDVCDGTPVAFTFASTHPFDTYAWDFGDGTSSSETNPIHVYAQPGTYTVMLTGTSLAATRTVTTTVTVLPVPELWLEDAYSICAGNVIIVSAPQGFDSYQWSTGGTGEEITVTEAGTYSLTVTANGCEATREFTVTTHECYEIPRGISPNGDGLNDSFDLSAMNVNKMSIFNRYGVEVFTKENYISQWQGQTDDGTELPDGTYFYRIENAFANYTGWVYINR